ncbi:hypothetical protein FHT86_006672 [Rhizobium sp. BK313]|uniref:LarC family nickel insertion protein n=1 Tax=Rhizobium sp. BK313 TaxID=2587081 RepID=UPI0010EA6EFD|nr:LarC family nickel insertion protein [Rhizobium sp. BK313]MBB3458346.1 hypothetical protein [Rhizobium sp. BK313]
MSFPVMPREPTMIPERLELHLDPLGGIAGDMFAAALLDLRPDLEAGLKRTLALCPLIEDVEFEFAAHNDGVLTGHRFLVRRDGNRRIAEDQHHHHHSHEHHDHDEHGHVHGSHHHTHWSLIREALITSKLDRDTVKHAVGIFSRLAEAEGKVHGVDPDAVSFHEVGAWDSIADIVAAAWLISQFDTISWTVGPLPLGGGRVHTDHGLLPVPAPATARLLEGFSTIDDGIGGERVTPTGAAILAYLCGRTPVPPKPRTLTGSGYGFGTRRLPGISNCLRILAFESAEAYTDLKNQVAVLECEIDDQTGEDLAQAVERLRAQTGVLDVIQAPVFGKKGRMMTHLRILAEPAARDDILASIFDETTTIGVRHILVERSTLPRQAATTEADGRTLRLKVVERPTGRTAKVEADDLADVAGSAARNRLRHIADTAVRKGEEED